MSVLRKRGKTAVILRKAGAVVFILAAVLCVAAVWRLALQNGMQEENEQGLENEETWEEEGVIYRFSKNRADAYVFVLDNGAEDTESDYADAMYVDMVSEDEIYGADGEHITEAELDMGDRVKVVSNGVVLETYPGSYEKVYRVEVMKKADEAEREACIRRYQEALSGYYTEPDPSVPPSIQLSYTEGQTASCIVPARGGYQWSWELEDGQTRTAAADMPFITEWQNLTEVALTEADQELEILLGKENADAVTVFCWSEDVKNMEEVPEGESVKAEYRDGRWYLTETKRGYYYLIHVSWGENYVEYGFFSKSPEASVEEASGERTCRGFDFALISKNKKY